MIHCCQGWFNNVLFLESYRKVGVVCGLEHDTRKDPFPTCYHQFHSTKMDQNGAWCQICTPCRGSRSSYHLSSFHITGFSNLSSLSKSPRQAHIAPCAVRGAPFVMRDALCSATRTDDFSATIDDRNPKSKSAGVAVVLRTGSESEGQLIAAPTVQTRDLCLSRAPR